jgi:hypothetical protein
MPANVFHNWLLKEGKDIFGFEREIVPVRRNPHDDEPLKTFNIEEVMNYLVTCDVGPLSPKINFVNEIRWGDGSGAIRVRVGTNLDVMIEKQGIDLRGDPRWYTARVYQLRRDGAGGTEVTVANEILDVVKKVAKQPMPSPTNEYVDLENLVFSIANAIRKTGSPIFLFEGIRKIGDNNYIVMLGLRGHGVEHQDQKRVMQNQTHITYSKDTGIIRIFNYNIESPVGKSQNWKLMEADVDWYFAPNQPREEIVETIANTLHWY